MLWLYEADDKEPLFRIFNRQALKHSLETDSKKHPSRAVFESPSLRKITAVDFLLEIQPKRAQYIPSRLENKGPVKDLSFDP